MYHCQTLERYSISGLMHERVRKDDKKWTLR
jgi:hypothetical protein